MLTIATELRISELHGLGVFATEPIAKSQVVWRPHRSCDVVYPSDLLATLPAAFREAVEYYGYRDRESGAFMYDVDNGRFINHSEDPNLKRGRRVMTALRDIAPGEEITADYRLFCDDCADDLEKVFAEARSFVDDASLQDNPPPR